MKSFFTFCLSLYAVFLFTGCGPKIVPVRMLEPAEVSVLSDKKNIAVANFTNDKIGLSDKIESELAKVKIEGKKYYTVVNRQQLDKIFAEQKLQSSEMVDASTASKIGKLIGVKAIITGKVNSATGASGFYMQDKKECLNYYKDGACAKWHFYKVKCDTVTANVSTSISIIDVETAAILYGDTYNESFNADSCKAGQTSLGGLLLIDTGPKQILSKDQAISKLSEYIAQYFVTKLVPHYVIVYVALLNDLDVELPDPKEDKFEFALEYMSFGRYKKAEKILQSLLDDVDGKSATIAYDLGVVKEALGELEEAQKLYKLADENTVKPIEEINKAILRIESSIEKRKLAKKQIEK